MTVRFGGMRWKPYSSSLSENGTIYAL
jgi:hypothetical protein